MVCLDPTEAAGGGTVAIKMPFKVDLNPPHSHLRAPTATCLINRGLRKPDAGHGGVMRGKLRKKIENSLYSIR